jgi:hypothetical protein
MTLLKKIGEAVLLAILIFLLFIIVFEKHLQLPPWLFVAGRMHPMFLHFPIVLLLLYFIILWLPLFENKDWCQALGLVAALSAVITTTMGLILSLEENREGDIFTFHKWGGIAVALLASLIYYLNNVWLNRKVVMRPATVIAAGLILFTGHWGAGLTHGENYLLAPLATEKQKASFDKAYAYEDVVQPVLLSKCRTCHSTANKKGGLSLEDSLGVLAGGKTGPLFFPGKPDSSLIISRLLLPLEHKKHMAPKSEAQLTDEEIQLLKAWIKSGAPMHKKLITLPPTDTFKILAASYLSPAANNIGVAYSFPPADEEKIKKLTNNYRIITPLSLGSPALAVQFYGKDFFTSKALEELLPIKQQITELSLQKLPVKDQDLTMIKQFINLEKLNLNYTDVTNSGITELTVLKKLKELSLSGTSVIYSGLAKIVALPELTSVFIWGTGIDSSQAAKLHSLNKNVAIETGYLVDKDTATYTLTSPIIVTPTGIFEPPVMLELKHGIQGVEIRYTLDGSEPDSSKSTVYKQPIPLDSSIKLKAKAYRQGWHSSTVAEATFVRKGFEIDSIQILSLPDSNFNPGNAGILHDEIIGNPINFKSKKWFGYFKTEGSFLITLKNTVEAKELWLAVADGSNSILFPPKTIEIWGGTDKTHLKFLGKTAPGMPSKYRPSGINYIQARFDPTTIRFLKLIAQPVLSMPTWHNSKGKPARMLISEIVVN